jgi:preprotein translocase subunit YajC
MMQIPVFADAAPTTSFSSFLPIILLVVMLGVFYFLIMRPQKKQEKEINQMRENLQIGDEISTTGGILGRVVKIKDDIVTIETGSDKNKIKIFKWAVRAVEVPANSEEEEEN